MKKERGAITLITLVTILFMIAFLISTFVIIMNRRQAQAEIKKEAKEIYESDVENVAQIYQSYFAEEGDIVPIRTANSLIKATNAIENNKKEYIYANSKIYTCTANTNYKLEKNIEFKVSDYVEKYPDCFMDEQITVSGQTTTVKRWKDLEYEQKNGKFKGTINYNEKTIKETDTGNNLVEHSEIEELEYIEGTGTQWIDTQIKPDVNTRFEVELALTNITDTMAIMGARVALNGVSMNLFFVNGDLRWDYGTAKTSSGLTYTVGNIVHIEKGIGKIDITSNSKTKSITSTSTINISNNIYLFNVSQGGTAETRFGKFKLYYCKIWQGDTLVRDYIPALDTDDVPCLYDKVSKTYFYNSGTGTFNYQ